MKDRRGLAGTIPSGRNGWLVRLLIVLWSLTVVGLLLRNLTAPTRVGAYDIDIDTYLYLGQRLLGGHPMYVDGFNAKWPIVSILYAPSAWLGSIRAHRIVVLLVNGLGAWLVAVAIRALARAELLPLRRGSLIPLGCAVLYLVMSQKMVGGLSGHLHQFANGFLLLAVALLARRAAACQAGGGLGLASLAAAGASAALAVAVRPNLLYPAALLAAALLGLAQPWRRQGRRGRWAMVGATAAGVVAVPLALFLPYLAFPDGPARAWAGAVRLPLEWAAQRPSESTGAGELIRDLAGSSIAGLEVWTVALVPLLGVLRLGCRSLGGSAPGRRPLLVPALCLLYVAGLVWSFLRTHFWGHYELLLAPPLALLVAAGVAPLEADPRPAPRRLAAATALALSLILCNNTLLVELGQLAAPPRPPAPETIRLEQDRARLLAHLRALPPRQRTFTSPQDFSFHWQLAMPASTAGVHPSWSLDPYGMRRSWATDRLGLAISEAQACAQLTDRRHRHVIWRRTERGGRHGEAFLLACLASDPAGWEEISGAIGLTSGELRVFRRRGPADGVP